MATTTTTTTTPLRMKLLVDTRAQRVLFAEASKEVVDFLFSFLALPMGTVVSLLGNESVVGSVGNLNRSVENLERSYAQPGVDMDALLRPVVLPPAAGSLASLFRLPDASARPRCPSCDWLRPGIGQDHQNRTRYTRCGTGYGRDGQALDIVVPSLELSDLMPNRYTATTAVGGFVQGNMTYTVMDDLTVAPMSTISSITVFMNTMAVRDGVVQERTVLIGNTEALKILKASFESRTVLTDVFVRNRAPAGLLAR